VNGAGKTTQLQMIMGRIAPDTGEIIKAKRNMRIAYLAQVCGCGWCSQWHGCGCAVVLQAATQTRPRP